MKPSETPSPFKKSFIIFETDVSSYHLNIVRQGVEDYLARTSEKIEYSPLSFNELKLFSASEEIDIGVVAWLRDPTRIDLMKELQIPYLNLYESANPSNTNLRFSFQGEGTLAADFFINEMHFEHLGFIGLKNIYSSERRFREFAQRAHQSGISVQTHWQGKAIPLAPLGTKRSQQLSSEFQLIQLIRQIPKPAGIFCANDRLAITAQYVAEEMGFSVPEDVSIIGVGAGAEHEKNEPKHVSIIQLDHFKQGQIAASMMLNHLLNRPQKEPDLKMAPHGILHRSTTMNQQVQDPLIQKTLTLIQKDPAICIDEICTRLGISRRTLENRFRATTNITLARAIDRERFNKAKSLIQTSRYKQGAIAGLAGYANREQMRRSFLRFTSMNPSQYRRDCKKLKLLPSSSF